MLSGGIGYDADPRNRNGSGAQCRRPVESPARPPRRRTLRPRRRRALGWARPGLRALERAADRVLTWHERARQRRQLEMPERPHAARHRSHACRRPCGGHQAVLAALTRGEDSVRKPMDRGRAAGYLQPVKAGWETPDAGPQRRHRRAARAGAQGAARGRGDPRPGARGQGGRGLGAGARLEQLSRDRRDRALGQPRRQHAQARQPDRPHPRRDPHGAGAGRAAARRSCRI